MSDRKYNGDIQRLRSPDRIQRGEPDRVVLLCLDGIEATSMLDIGTGSALFAEAFYKAGLSVTGVDVNPEMIEAAKQFIPDGNFHLAPAESLSFEDGAFDLVFMAFLLHEVDDYVKTLTEAGRVAKQRIAVLEFPKIEQPFGPPLEHRLSEQQVTDFAEQAGLGKPEIHTLTHLVLYLWNTNTDTAK